MSHDDVTEVLNLMGECFGFTPSRQAIEDLKVSAPHRWDEGDHWGFADTEVRENLMTAFSKLLTGLPAYTYGEARELNIDEDVYFASVKLAHDERYGSQALAP